MSEWLTERWGILKSIFERSWFKIAAVIWAVIGAYDLLGDQVLPKWLAEKMPPVRDVIDMTTGWLPWWAWAWIGTALLTAAAVEYAVRLHQATRPSRSNRRKAGQPQTALSPAQERLLELVSDYQRRFAASKLIINRTEGTLHFDDAPNRAQGINLIRDLYGSSGAVEASKFEALVESMPSEYTRQLPEARWDNPFVLSVTEVGSLHLKQQAAATLPLKSPIEIVFDPDDDRCVRRKERSTRFSIGVRNGTVDHRTISDVSLRALESTFAVRVLAWAHGRINYQTGRLLERDPILQEWVQLDPGVTEYVELFGVDTSATTDREEILKTAQQFTIEVRARDTPRATAVFEYDPNKDPALARLA